MTSAFSWQNSISLCPASFCILRPNLPVTPGVCWLPTFAFQSSKWKGHLFWVLVLKGLVGLHRTVQLQLLQHYWLGPRLGLPWYWMVCLKTNRDYSVVFEIASKYCILDSFVDNDGYCISCKGFLPTVVDIMVIWVKFTHSSPFTLAISCLTTSNLPWFMDLTFQVPMQYCSLQHRTLLLSTVTSTAGCCFCFGSIPSFFLELFLHSSPVAYWAPTDLGSSSFSFLSFCLHAVHGVLKARILKGFAIPFSSGPHTVRPLHHDPPVLGGPTWHGS